MTAAVRFLGRKHPIAAEYGQYPVPLRRLRPLDTAAIRAGYEALADPRNIKALGRKEKPYPSAVCYYRPAFLEPHFRTIGDHIRQFLDFDIVETYWYARLYGPGDELRIHTDRGGCFVSVSVCFGYDFGNLFPKGSAWPINVLEDDEGPTPRPVAFALAPGEGILYPGCSAPHWRDMFLGDRCGQAFFHWVPADPARFAEFYGDPEKA